MVRGQVLAALAPAALALSPTAAAGLQDDAGRRERDWQLRPERARHQTERARRQYDAAEPEDRLVARELGRRREEALRAEQRLREEYARPGAGRPRELTVAAREQIPAPAADIPGPWATAGPADRQAIVRHLVERVEIDATTGSEVTRVTARWAGGGVSRREPARPVPTYEQRGEFPRPRERIRELVDAGRQSGEIAAQLNADGFRSPRGGQRFTADRSRQIVCRLGLRARRPSPPADAPSLERHEAWMAGRAGELGIPTPALMAWCERGGVGARAVGATVLRGVVWADAAERARLERLAGGRKSG